MDFTKATFKDFENVEKLDIFQRAKLNNQYLNYLDKSRALNYQLLAISGCNSEIRLAKQKQLKEGSYISFVSNDYLGFSQHPKVKETVIKAVEKYGTGAGASPLIGGYFEYHKEVEDKISIFFNRPIGSTIIYTTGYTANSASLLCLLKKEDIAIVDMAVHSSVYEGIMGTTVKRFLHNNLDHLEKILKGSKDKYRTKMVVIDGVYSQDGDTAPLKEIIKLCKLYNAVLMVDDAHGIGLYGKTGRGVAEHYEVLNEIDIITGTFSKTFGNVGGYFVATPELISYLRYQSRQYAFSASATPNVLGVSTAIDLIDEEPKWREKLWNNINHFKNGLLDVGLNIGVTESAIIPVKVDDKTKAYEAVNILLENKIYANPITYPAVSVKDPRIRMSLMSTHTKEQLDKTLNVFEDLRKRGVL